MVNVLAGVREQPDRFRGLKRHGSSKLRKNSGKPIPRVLKHARSVEGKELIGTTEVVPFPKPARIKVFLQPVKTASYPTQIFLSFGSQLKTGD